MTVRNVWFVAVCLLAWSCTFAQTQGGCHRNLEARGGGVGPIRADATGWCV
jgi:hypothetical protein